MFIIDREVSDTIVAIRHKLIVPYKDREQPQSSYPFEVPSASLSACLENSCVPVPEAFRQATLSETIKAVLRSKKPSEAKVRLDIPGEGESLILEFDFREGKSPNARILIIPDWKIMAINLGERVFQRKVGDYSPDSAYLRNLRESIISARDSYFERECQESHPCSFIL